VRKLLLEEDTTRPFVGSSPSNGLQSEKENWISKNAQDWRYGDVHYYNYKSPLWNWKLFPSAKFASEYGFQSYPSLETLSQVIKENDLTFPISKAIEHHQHHGGGTAAIENQICMSFIFSKFETLISFFNKHHRKRKDFHCKNYCNFDDN
jgi:beta-mannosidase